MLRIRANQPSGGTEAYYFMMLCSRAACWWENSKRPVYRFLYMQGFNAKSTSLPFEASFAFTKLKTSNILFFES